MVHPLRNILSKLRWESNKQPSRYLITYLHRGAPNDVKDVRVSEIVTLGKSYFILHSVNGEETTIPFHRILRVYDGEMDSVLWEKRKTDKRRASE